jgi:ferredoxin-NADP reductase/nitrite reductase/ring-hydroxylating ferredoxin subunit
MAEDSGYQKVANKKDLQGEHPLIRVELDGKPIVLSMVNEKIYAMDAVCSHEGGPLEEGTLEGYELKCPWHYAIFDVRNAKVSEQTVWATDLQSYPVKVDDTTGDIMVRLQTTKQASGEGEEATLVKSTQDSDGSQKKYYEEQEREAGNKLSLELLSKEKLQETDIMTFRIARGGIDYTAGQYAFFKIDGVYGDAKGPIRHFSIASSPTEQDYIQISTRIRDTPYKQKLASLEEGTKILAWGPRGEFVLHDDDHSKPAVFLSGGIGVTPFRSMIKFATDKQLPIKITMFDSNRNQHNILYRNEFDSCTSQNKNLKIVYTVTEEEQVSNTENWSGERGRIDKSMLEKYLTKDEIGNAVFYVCGPPGMLKAIQELLQKELQVSKDRLKIEAFTGY